MGLSLGEAPEGWFSVSDTRYFNAGAVLAILNLFVIFVLGAVFSTDPLVFFTDEAMWFLYATLLIILLIIGLVHNENKRTGHQATFGRSFRVSDTDTLVRDVKKVVPLQYRPINRTTETQDLLEDDETRTETLVLKECLGLRHIMVLVIKPKRHFVNVTVKTSDRDARQTQDLLDMLLEFFEGRMMDWLSVDVDEDAGLLMAMGKEERQQRIWHNNISVRFNNAAAMVIFFVMVAFWAAAAWAILDPNNDTAMVLAAFGMLLSFILIGLLMLIMAENLKASNYDFIYEYDRVFHASPWYVSAAIEEGLTAAGWRFQARTRVDPSSQVRSECFEVSTRGGDGVTIDVAWEDHDTDPNWSCVRVRTPGEPENVQPVLDLVRKSVFDRYLRLGL